MPVITKDYATTRHGQVHFRRVDGPGPPIVLLHRTPVDSACFESLLETLAGRRAAIAFDTPGFGQSFSPAGQPSARDYAIWLLEALDSAGVGAIDLFGHHTGSHFAIEMARQAPERVSSLTLSGVLYANAAERAVARAAVSGPAPIDSDGRYIGHTWRIIRGLYATFQPKLIHSEVVSALACRNALNQVFGAIHDHDVPAALAQVRTPVRICQASDDPLDKYLHRVRSDLPHIRIERHGPAGMAAPELQFEALADTLLDLAPADEHSPPAPQGLPMTDRRIQLVRAESGFRLKAVEAERPTPIAGQVLVRVRAASLNRRDLMIRAGAYGAGGADGFTPLSDAAGEIVAVGEGVSGVRVGDRVASTFFQNWPQGRFTSAVGGSALGAGGLGVLAEHIVLSEQGVAPIPDDWSYEEGATIPCAAVTAWTGLAGHGGLQKDDWVLLIGTGGVALFGLQIAAASGARAIVLSSSDEKLGRAREMGAALTVNYRTTPEWGAAVREKTGGVQHVLELGGAGTLAKSLAALAPGGRVALIGALDGFGGEIPAAGLVMGVQTVAAISVGSRADQLAVTQFLDAHKARPVIDSRFSLDDIEAAYACMQAGAFGKVVVTL